MKSLLLPSLFCVLFLSFWNHLAFSKEHVVKATAGDGTQLLFDPKDIEISAGDKVTWVNDSDVYHNVMAMQKDIPVGANQFKSTDLENKGDSWSYIFTIPGKYGYFCEPHLPMGMVGSVNVSEIKN